MLRLPNEILNKTGVNVSIDKEICNQKFKLPIKEKLCKSHDILRYTELILYSNCWDNKRNLCMKTVKVWDMFVRFFHWTLVGSIIGLYLSGEEFKSIHIRLGYFVTCLVLARIIWGFVGTKHARFNDFLYSPYKIFHYLKSIIIGNPTNYIGHNPAGGFMIIVMLIALLVTAFTGLKTLATEGQGPLATTDISILRVAYANEDEHDEHDDDRTYNTVHHQKRQKEEFWEEMHESMTTFMIFLIIIHLGGVTIASWLHKENLIIAMITGRKKSINNPTNHLR